MKQGAMLLLWAYCYGSLNLEWQCSCRFTHLISSYSVITEEYGRKGKGNHEGKKQEKVSWRDPWSRSVLSIKLPVSIAFITVASELSLFCSVIWDQSGGISSKQTWIRTFITAQLDSLPPPSSHTPMGRLQKKRRGWRCRLLSRRGLHHSVLYPPSGRQLWGDAQKWFELTIVCLIHLNPCVLQLSSVLATGIWCVKRLTLRPDAVACAKMGQNSAVLV